MPRTRKQLVTNPFTYLVEEHEKANELFEEIFDLPESAIQHRKKLFELLYNALSLHIVVEEQILYPKLETKSEIEDLITEAYEDHDEIRIMLEELNDELSSSPDWMEKLRVLQENVSNHVEEEEEEGGMFDVARSVLTRDEVEQLTDDMNDFLSDNLA